MIQIILLKIKNSKNNDIDNIAKQNNNNNDIDNIVKNKK